MKNSINVLLLLFVLINLSMINRVYAQTVNHWEMLVDAGDNWNYLLGYAAPEANWAEAGFDAGSWSLGPGGIGYGEGNEGTEILNDPSGYTSLYLRNTFSIADKSKISWSLLYVDFDDGFVAYLNGHEIARANMGAYGQKPAYDAYALNCDFEAQLPKGGTPARFIINPDSMVKYLIDGENILALEVHNCTNYSSDLASTTFLIAGIVDESSDYRSVPSWFTDPRQETTHLPLLLIDTWGAEIPDDPKIKAWLKVIDNGPGQTNHLFQAGTDYDSYIGIEIRGQSSQMFPKKSFGFETQDAAGEGVSVSLLGMPAEEDWVLYAPYSDKSLLRNALTYYLGSKMGSWQPRFKFVEIYLNGSYHGIYMLVEKIKRDANRVNINKLNPEEISGNDLTGGYILKVDKIHDLGSEEYFYTYPQTTYSNARNYAFTYEYPDYEDIVPQQKSYIADYLTDLENALNGSGFRDPVNGYRKYLDLNSFVDFQLVQELTNNVDGYRYSTFFYKKRDSDGGKLFAGPLWDFDLCYGNVDYEPDRLATDKWLFTHYGPNEYFCMHWWARLFEDESYKTALISRWQNLRTGPFKSDSIMNYIDSVSIYLGDAIDRNFQRWPILNTYIWPNAYVGESHPNEVSYLKNWLSARLNWLDASFDKISATEIRLPELKHIAVYPNPASEFIYLNLEVNRLEKLTLEVYDQTGRSVALSQHMPDSKGIQTIKINFPGLVAGNYLIHVKQGNVSIAIQKFMVN